MLLSELLDLISYGEVSQVKLGGGADGVIEEKEYPRFVSYVNQGMIDLHKRFPLVRGEIIVAQQTGLELYPLLFANALTNVTSGPVKYILDTAVEPFIKDVLKIEQVFNMSDDVEYTLNDSKDTNTIITPTYNTLKVFEPVAGVNMRVKFRSSCERISPLDLDTQTVDLIIPPQLETPLATYVTSRAMAAIPALGEYKESQELMSRYNRMCAMIRLDNAILKDADTNTKLVDNGWA